MGRESPHTIGFVPELAGKTVRLANLSFAPLAVLPWTPGWM